MKHLSETLSISKNEINEPISEDFKKNLKFPQVLMSTASHYQTAKSSDFRSQFQIAALLVLLNKYLQALKETPFDCENTFFNTSDFHRFHVHFIQLELFHLFNQNDSLDTFRQQKFFDAEKFKDEVSEVINASNQTDFDYSSETSINHTF